jgi:hypothetical protein
MHEGDAYKIIFTIPEGKRPLGIDWRIILKWVLGE